MENIPLKEKLNIRNKKIKAFYRMGFSMDQVCIEMKKLGYIVSKTTVFFALNGRSKKADERKKKRRLIRQFLH